MAMNLRKTPFFVEICQDQRFKELGFVEVLATYRPDRLIFAKEGSGSKIFLRFSIPSCDIAEPRI